MQQSTDPAPHRTGTSVPDAADSDGRQPRSPSGSIRRMERAVRAGAALVLLIVAASSPVMGWAAAEQYEGRRFYGIFEGDWFFLFALIAGAACVLAAARLLRELSERKS